MKLKVLHDCCLFFTLFTSCRYLKNYILFDVKGSENKKKKHPKCYCIHYCSEPFTLYWPRMCQGIETEFIPAGQIISTLHKIPGFAVSETQWEISSHLARLFVYCT